MSSVTGDGAGNTHADAAAADGEEVLNQNHFHGNSPNSIPSVITHSSGSTSSPQEIPPRRKRNQPGNPDPKALVVVALSPKSLIATNRFTCEVCNKGFQREQNLQLHRRGHNLPWKLKVREENAPAGKKVYVCPVPSCVHHSPTRALGDLTAIKKHYCRKHGEKRLRCDRCYKKYAVLSDWKAHTKICGTKEYNCVCGTIFSRKDSYETHRTICDALMKEIERYSNLELMANLVSENLMSSLPIHSNGFNPNEMYKQAVQMVQELTMENNNPPKQPLNVATAAGTGSMFSSGSAAAAVGSLFGGAAGGGSFATSKSATAVLQKATQMGATGNDEFGGVNSPLVSMMSNKSATTMTSTVASPSFLMNPQTADDDDDHRHGGFVNLLLNKKQNPPHQEIPSQFLLPINPNAGPSVGHGQHHDIGGFQKYQVELDLPNNPFMKKYDQDENVSSNNMNNTNSFLYGANNSESSPAAAAVEGANNYILPHGLPSRFGAERMTVDFLGIGGASRPRGGVNLQDHLDMEFNGGISQAMMQQGLNQFHHHAAAMKKPVWEF